MGFVCSKCGGAFITERGLTNHVTKTHHMTWAEYLEKYGHGYKGKKTKSIRLSDYGDEQSCVK